MDLRSDTVTRPTAAMRKAMAEAEVGDDVLGDDPTVKALEELAARTVGKEAALYVPSGTMANSVSVLTHTRRMGEVILEARCHIYNYESGSFSLVSGVSVRPVATPDGVLTPELVEAVLPPPNIHNPQPSLIAIENTHNWHSGRFWTRRQVDAIAEVARRRRLPLHCDGARIFNAALAARTTAKDLAATCDTVMFCVSKGLSAPVGSLVCGPREFIERARWARKALGGGMRQAGVIAAAGIVALKEMTGRLEEDHRNARRLAEGLASLPGIAVDPDGCPTNIVIFDAKGTGRTAAELVEAVGREGVKVLPRGPTTIRAVTHRHIGKDDVDRAVEAFRKVAGRKAR